MPNIYFIFLAVKGNRTLVWKPTLGKVNLDLVIGDKTINLNVQPIHAAIIYQFQIKSEWTVEQLSQVIKVPASTVRRRISYWTSQGILREIPNQVPYQSLAIYIN